MAGRNIYPTDIERAAARVSGVRPGCAVAVRIDAGHSRETFAVAVESVAWQDHAQVRRIERQVAHEVVVEVDVRPRNVVVLRPGDVRKPRRENCAGPTRWRLSADVCGARRVDLVRTMADYDAQPGRSRQSNPRFPPPSGKRTRSICTPACTGWPGSWRVRTV